MKKKPRHSIKSCLLSWLWWGLYLKHLPEFRHKKNRYNCIWIFIIKSNKIQLRIMTQSVISSLFWGQKSESSGENAYPDPVKMDLRFQLTAPLPKMTLCYRSGAHVCEPHVPHTLCCLCDSGMPDIHTHIQTGEWCLPNFLTHEQCHASCHEG